MVSSALKPNVQDLQEDVVDLLEQISSLMGHASDVLSNDNDNKYIQFQHQVQSEADKVKNLELRMAIVAPMKAGKSTIVNAIAGQEILPSRNSAMTTLPTEIIFDAEATEPVLHLSSEILSVFQETLLKLRSKIDKIGLQQAEEDLSQYPHLVKMPKQIYKSVGLTIPAKSEGREKIIHTLTSLNDIVRLCSILDPQADPIPSLTEVPRIKTPFWRLQKTEQQSELGNLVIIDTPGPNEAGENLRLQAVVADQLRKSSIVLIVLDFTQLKNEAAEKVKTDVAKVIKLRGKENLYVLINKVDQRRDTDMGPEQVKQFVAAEFGIVHADNKNRVFEVSARRAFTSANFLQELQQNSNLCLSETKTARALAQEVLGIDWEEELNDLTAEGLQGKAEKLWKMSGFDPFLNGAINALMAEAAPRCIISALKVACGRLAELGDDVQLRSSAINADEDKLRFELGALDTDLQLLDKCRNRLQEVDKIKENLYQDLNNILDELKQKSQVNIENYFNDEEYHRAAPLKKGGMGIKKFTNWLSQNFRSAQPVGTGEIEFKTQSEAQSFIDKAIAFPKRRTDSLLDEVRETVRNKIEYSRQSLTSFLDKETKPIIKRARDRLNENFNVSLSLPTPNLDSEHIKFAKPSIKSNTRWVDQGYETKEVKKRKFSHWFWIIPQTEKIQVKRPDKKEEYYTVSLQEIVDESNNMLEQSIVNIKRGVNQYLEEDFKERIDLFFEELNIYLGSYCDSLTQAQSDQKLKAEEREKLVNEFSYLLLGSRENTAKVDKSLRYADELIRNK